MSAADWSTCTGRWPWTEQELVRMVFAAAARAKLAPEVRVVLLSLWSRRDAEGAVCARLVPTEEDTGLDRAVALKCTSVLRKMGWLVPFKRFDAAGPHDWWRFAIPRSP